MTQARKKTYPFLILLAVFSFMGWLYQLMVLPVNAGDDELSLENAGIYINQALQPADTITETVFLPLLIGGAGQNPNPDPDPDPDPTFDLNSWHGYVNYMRWLADLPPITENLSLSNGCSAHSRYMVENNDLSHTNSDTPEGTAAAAASNIFGTSWVDTSDQTAIDFWMTGPFHGIGLIDPAVGEMGFGSYRNENAPAMKMSACIDILSGRTGVPPEVTFPVFWPEDGKEMPFTTYFGGEFPDPLTPCNGYSPPTGAPIYLQLGTGSIVPNVTSSSLIGDGGTLDHCVYNETNYVHPDQGFQNLGRSILNFRDAVVLMPRNPLEVGSSYDVSITINGQSYNWSFVVTDGVVND